MMVSFTLAWPSGFVQRRGKLPANLCWVLIAAARLAACVVCWRGGRLARHQCHERGARWYSRAALTRETVALSLFRSVHELCSESHRLRCTPGTRIESWFLSHSCSAVLYRKQHLSCFVSSCSAAFIRNVAPPEASDAHWLLDFYKSFSHYGAGKQQRIFDHPALQASMLMRDASFRTRI